MSRIGFDGHPAVGLVGSAATEYHIVGSANSMNAKRRMSGSLSGAIAFSFLRR